MTTRTAPAVKSVQVQAEPVQAVKPSSLPTTKEIAATLRARAMAYKAAGGSLDALCREAGVHKDSVSELARIVRGDWPYGLSTTRVDRLSGALTARGF
jgi:hypothetical protein